MQDLFAFLMAMLNNQAKEEILSYLDQKGIPYRIFSHEKTDLLWEKLQNDRKHGIVSAAHCKNLVLCNRSRTRFYLLTMAFGKRFQTGPVSRQMGSGRLNFASDEDLARLLCARPGMVSPLELIFDKNKELSFFMDRDLARAPRLCFHPADETATVVLEQQDFFDAFLPTLSVVPGFVTIPPPAENGGLDER